MAEPIKADTHASPLRCRKCGSNRFVVPDYSTDDSLVTCGDCGAEIGRWGNIRVGILEEGKETSALEKAEKAKLGRWEGIVTGTHEDKSTVTVRRRNGFEQTIHYDSSTRWTSQEHHSQQINTIDASQVKIWDRVICVGFY